MTEELNTIRKRAELLMVKSPSDVLALLDVVLVAEAVRDSIEPGRSINAALAASMHRDLTAALDRLDEVRHD